MLPLTGAGLARAAGSSTTSSTATDLLGATNSVSRDKNYKLTDTDLNEIMSSTNCPLCRYAKDSNFDHNLQGCPNKKRFGWKEVKYDRTTDTRRPEDVRKAEKLKRENDRDGDYSAKKRNQEKEAAAQKEKDEKARLAKDIVCLLYTSPSPRD